MLHPRTRSDREPQAWLPRYHVRVAGEAPGRTDLSRMSVGIEAAVREVSPSSAHALRLSLH